MMKLPLTQEQILSLRAFLEADCDSEQISGNEYVCDLYALAVPLSLDLVFKKDGVFIDGAAALRYDEELDGWYISDSITDLAQIERALRDSGAL